MSNEFSGSKPDAGIAPSQSIRGPGKVLGFTLGFLILGAVGLVYWVAYASQRTNNGSSATTVQEKHVSYQVTYEVRNDPVRVVTPFGYKADYRWGYAPLDTRTNANPEWLNADKVPERIEGGQMVQWREWRLNNEYDGKAKAAKVVYTFTKVF